jgi:dynein heavy chain 1
MVPSLRGYADALTQAMLTFYLRTREKLTPAIQSHYIYSPRELTRWVRGIYLAINNLDLLSMEGLVRIWAHEALRLFHDRLILESERQWTYGLIEEVAAENFLNVDLKGALRRPILYSNWLTKEYMPVERDALRHFVQARLRVFCEEELEVPLILFDELLEHVLRVDRVLRQPQGHLIMIGISSWGKVRTQLLQLNKRKLTPDNIDPIRSLDEWNKSPPIEDKSKILGWRLR